MKRLCFASLLVALAATATAASPTVDLQMAASSLRRESNYSWVTQEKVDGYKFYQPSPVIGKTVKGGFTEVTLKYTSRKDTRAIFKDDQYVVETANGWSTPEELPKLAQPKITLSPGVASGEGSMSGGISFPGGSIGSPSGSPFPGGGMGRRRDPFPSGPSLPEDPGLGGPTEVVSINALAFSESDMILRRPDEMVQLLTASVRDLKSADGVISGELTEDGAIEMLYGTVFTGSQRYENPTPRNASGTVKFWVKDWQLGKFEVQAQGTFIFGRGKSQKDYLVKRTITTELKDAGLTKVQAPDGARRRLGP